MNLIVAPKMRALRSRPARYWMVSMRPSEMPLSEALDVWCADYLRRLGLAPADAVCQIHDTWAECPHTVAAA